MKKILLIIVLFMPGLLWAQDENVLEEEYQNYFVTDIAQPMQLGRNINFVRYRYRGYDNIFTVDKQYIDFNNGAIYWNAMSSLDRIRRDNRRTVAYSSTNRNYAHRLLVATPLGQYATFQADRKWGKNGFVDGLGSDITNATFDFHSKWWGKHKIALTYNGNWGSQGVRSAVTQEVYDLSNNIFYNPNMGLQNGKIRNSKTRQFGQHFITLSHEIIPIEGFTINSQASYYTGENSFTLLSWYDAPTPYPDYYRSLPDFAPNSTVAEFIRNGWASGNPQITQIDWKKLYEINLLNDNDTRSQYVLKDLVRQNSNISGRINMTYLSSPILIFKAMIKGGSYYSSNFSRLNDLLGGSYWLDIDQYLLDDEYYGDKIQNNIRQPNRKIVKGDTFGYNYTMSTSNASAGGSFSYRPKQWAINGNVSIGTTSHSREGLYEKESFAGGKSLGKSPTVRFSEYSLSGDAVRFLGLHNRLWASVEVASVAPLAQQVFVSPEYRNQTVSQPQGIDIKGIELRHIYSSRIVNISTSIYAREFTNDRYITSFFDDASGQYANLVMSNIDKFHRGVEIELELRPSTNLTIKSLVAINRYSYESNPTVDILADKDAQPIVTASRTFLKGYRLGGAPQKIGVIDLHYRLARLFNVGASLNYAGDNFSVVNPIRRMARVVDYAGSPELKAAMLSQESMGDAVTVNAMISKEFQLKNKDRISIWCSVENLLDNRAIKYGGYEQMRFSRTTAASGREYVPFATKFYYAYGRNYYAILSYIF